MLASNQCSRGCWLSKSGPYSSFAHVVFSGHWERRTVTSWTISSLNFLREESKKGAQVVISTAVNSQVETRRWCWRKYANEKPNAILSIVEEFWTKYETRSSANELIIILDAGGAIRGVIPVSVSNVIDVKLPKSVDD